MVSILGSVVLLLLAFYVLHRVTDQYFVQSLEHLSRKLRLTTDIAGATLMAMGSSSPELFTSLLALVKGHAYGNLGAGTIVGSAIFNILVIVGASALFRTAVLTWQPVIRDLVFYILTIGLLYWVFLDGVITFSESIYFVLGYLLYLAILPLWRRVLPYTDHGALAYEQFLAEEQAFEKRHPVLLRWVWPVDWALARIMPDLQRHPRAYPLVFVLSIAVITAMSWVLVETGVVLAHELGVPEAVIGLTVLAVGTSVPDLLASMIVARQGRGDMAVGNAVGSNIFDILVGLGVVWMIMISARDEPVPISTENLHGSVVLLLATVAALLFLLIVRRWAIGRRAGLLLIGLYGAYLLAALLGYY